MNSFVYLIDSINDLCYLQFLLFTVFNIVNLQFYQITEFYNMNIKNFLCLSEVVESPGIILAFLING